jgi:hypothetical protein
MWEDTVVVPAEYKTRYLPFNGQAPNLKEAVFWRTHIDWEGALPNFLRGLRNLELSYLKKNVRPTFAEIIRNSPELRTLTLSIARPVLADPNQAWGSVPLAMPSLTKKYATALVQHLTTNVDGESSSLRDGMLGTIEEDSVASNDQSSAKGDKGKQSVLFGRASLRASESVFLPKGLVTCSV